MKPNIGENINIDRTTFKFDRANAWAMIEGFKNNPNKPEEQIKQAIYCVISTERDRWQENIGRLFTYATSQNANQPLSRYGNDLLIKHPKSRNNNSFVNNSGYPELNYIAVCDTIYEIQNDYALWNEICFSGEYENIFGIWLPEAPYNRFYDIEKDRPKRPPYFIVLLRVYQIDCSFNMEHLEGGESFNPHYIKNEYYDDLANPILVDCLINDTDFKQLKDDLETALNNSNLLVNTVILNDTLEDFDEGGPIGEGGETPIKVENEIDKYCKLLKECKPQIILQGAPGTGKTFTAEEIAKKLTNNNEDEYKIIQFHPAYSYEDFVRGIVAKPAPNGVIYEVEDKILLDFVNKAKKDENKNFVLILDEINRANLPSVLGELIFALEYRGKFVDCLYKKGTDNKIKLPNNLYIIGTMNTADRSVGNIDYAIRRRFAFVTLKSEKQVIETVIKDINVKNKAINLFSAVNLLFTNIAPDYNKDDVMIGHSYFLADNLSKLELKLEYEIKPILREYVKDGILLDNNGLLNKINSLKV